jgi:hypothetical protein
MCEEAEGVSVTIDGIVAGKLAITQNPTDVMPAEEGLWNGDAGAALTGSMAILAAQDGDTVGNFFRCV